MSSRRRRYPQRPAAFAMAAAALLFGSGCADESASGPPVVHLGDSICAECGMIISDARFATATIIASNRGATPELFDDFICQMNSESSHPGNQIVARWCHDYDSAEWIDMESAFFLRSPRLKSPMASHLAAFRTREAATAAVERFGGDVLVFDQLNTRSSAP